MPGLALTIHIHNTHTHNPPPPNQIRCEVCSFTIYPARGREFKFFPAGFKCPSCGATKEKFYDLTDPDDPRNQEVGGVWVFIVCCMGGDPSVCVCVCCVFVGIWRDLPTYVQQPNNTTQRNRAARRRRRRRKTWGTTTPVSFFGWVFVCCW